MFLRMKMLRKVTGQDGSVSKRSLTISREVTKEGKLVSKKTLSMHQSTVRQDSVVTKKNFSSSQGLTQDDKRLLRETVAMQQLLQDMFFKGELCAGSFNQDCFKGVDLRELTSEE